jgi:hypothetical protein
MPEERRRSSKNVGVEKCATFCKMLMKNNYKCWENVVTFLKILQHFLFNSHMFW